VSASSIALSLCPSPPSLSSQLVGDEDTALSSFHFQSNSHRSHPRVHLGSQMFSCRSGFICRRQRPGSRCSRVVVVVVVVRACKSGRRDNWWKSLCTGRCCTREVSVKKDEKSELLSNIQKKQKVENSYIESLGLIHKLLSCQSG
jgi:hypothetical protein